MTSVDFVEVFQGIDGQWYYRSKANNHQVLSVSEGYTNATDARRAAQHEHSSLSDEKIVKLQPHDGEEDNAA